MSLLPVLLLLVTSIMTPTMAQDGVVRAGRQGQEDVTRNGGQGQKELIMNGGQGQGQDEVIRAISAVAEYNARLGAELGGKHMIVIISIPSAYSYNDHNSRLQHYYFKRDAGMLFLIHRVN